MKHLTFFRQSQTRSHSVIACMISFLMLMLLTSCGADPQDTLNDSSLTAEPENDEPSTSYAMEIHFLDVGQGLSILVTSNEDVLLYDGGDRSHSSSVVSYLKRQNIDQIDYLISSHYDEDHVSGLIGCLNAFEVEHVIVSNYVHDSNLYESFQNAVAEHDLTIIYPEVGTEFFFGSGSFTILSPEAISSDSNNNSVAIKLTNNEHNFLFMGDAEHESESDIIDSGIELSCNVLCLGHHGSASSTSWDLLQACVPEYAVISCGEDNKYGHPDTDTMDKLASMEIPVFRTDKQGTIIATSDGTSLTWNVEACNDYSSGDSNDIGTIPQTESTPKQTTTEDISQDETLQTEPTQNESTQTVPTQNESAQTESVWLSATGTKYHSIPDCGTMNPDTARQVTKEEAIAQGYDACKRCH